MELWQAVVLGIVQGLTEFLPISSTAHLLLVQELWFGIPRETIKDSPYTVVIQLGTLAAVFVYFRRDVVNMLAALWTDLSRGHLISSATPDGRLAKLIIIGSIPAGLAGLFLGKFLEEHFYNPVSIGIVAIVLAFLMLASEWWARRFSRGAETVTLFEAVFIGTFQAIALMPGGSRSGCTITAGLFAGLTRSTAARFSFLLSLPIMLAAGLKKLYDWLKSHNQAEIQHEMLPLAIGTLVAGIVGYLSIAWLLAYLRKNSTLGFVIYRIILGVLILVMVALHYIPR